ncbi:MAG: 2-C-methyl-D-erythritol 2,4-cyclodiphosphate synthase [Candidatus Riflemargulisbacteria bacterium]
MRIGNGFDVHEFKEDRDLIIGGVKMNYPLGLLGHSDADVLTHAVMDALLGAAGKGDIGRHFPDTDKQYKGISSLILLKQVVKIISPYVVNNIDVTIIAQEPKMAPFIPQMEKNLSDIIGVSLDQINIKATTTEKLGFTGRKEGIAVLASATLTND